MATKNRNLPLLPLPHPFSLFPSIARSETRGAPMDRPSLPSLSTAGGLTSLSGLLPPASLIESLLLATRELAAFDPLPFLQTRNTTAAIQHARLLSSLLEDLAASGGGGGASLPPSSILCLTELCSVVRRTKALLDDLAAGSLLWTLLNAEAAAKRFHSCTRELAAALDILPLSLLSLSLDVREQVELLHRQAKRADLFLDPRELRLREELFSTMAGDRAASKGFQDFRKAEEILRKTGLRTAAGYQEEIRRLESEIPKQAGTGGLMAVSNINSLIAFVSYARTIIFRCSKSDGAIPRQPAPAPAALSRSSSWSVATAQTQSNFIFPDEFRCPITLDLMKDPVIVASGHTYDRSSISRWLKSGHHTCPKSGQKLLHVALVPNYALKSLMEQWCRDNHLPATMWQKAPAVAAEVHAAGAGAIDHVSETRAAVEAVRMTAEFLVGKLAMGSPETQRQAAYELRLLAKTGMDNRRIIAEAGAIPFLITLLSSGDPQTQENAVTALLNLSIFDNNKTLIMAAGAIDAIVAVLKTGAAMEARENAAAAIFSLSMMEDGKAEIGKRPEAIAGLVGLLREGTASGKRDAATALFSLALHCPNKAAVVAAGAVPVLVELLTDGKAGITDDALAMLALLCGCEEGMREIGRSKAVVAILVDLIRFGSQKGKENAIAVLLGLCRDGGEEMGSRLLMNARSVPSLQSLAASGSPRARRKADALLRLLNRCCSQSNSLHV
ncbi:U-box domain-containing protein 17 [Apostasia shenzhenica]|uniref:U-box domain-containing protein 12 n=1 Tax=Apostasia shenzhenica TaxID=1088818 RepID=A0A2I0AIE2_9ASPA|nr:U-box domain-containing protein 17 [Apostasia shenzhenica]